LNIISHIYIKLNIYDEYFLSLYDTNNNHVERIFVTQQIKQRQQSIIS